MPETTYGATERIDARTFVATDWKPFTKNTLRGFVTIVLPSGLKIKDVSLHERDGKQWIGLPSKPYRKQDGSTTYIGIIDFETNEARYRFQDLALDAINEMQRAA
jgi:hypothetical protein